MTFMDEITRDLASRVFLKTSGLGRNKTRDLHEHLSSRTGLHSTEYLARHFGVARQTILRRLRCLRVHGLVTQMKGDGRTDPGCTGGRDSDLWGAVPGESIGDLTSRVIGFAAGGSA